jgi:hypothetical protein
MDKLTFFKSVRLLWIVLAAFSPCCNYTTTSKNSKDLYSITVARGSSYGPNAYESMRLDSSCSLSYHGVAFVNEYGFHKGKISSTAWDIISDSCKKSQNIKSDTCWETSDATLIEIIIHDKNGVRRFRGEHNCLPVELVSIFDLLWRVKDKTKLFRSNEFSLETTAQNSYRGLPKDPRLPQLFKAEDAAAQPKDTTE